MDNVIPEGAPPADAPHLRVLAQYLKEVTFRNVAAAAAVLQAHDHQPTIDMGVQVKTRPMGAQGDAAEVDLCINVEAKRMDLPMFSADVIYSGVFQFVNVPAAELEPYIWIECPRLLFPFARQVLAEITREGGYPPLLINPMDFAPLYWAELRERENRAQMPPDTPPDVPLAGLTETPPESAGA